AGHRAREARTPGTIWCKPGRQNPPHRESSRARGAATVSGMNHHPQRLWHPFADMARVTGRELVLVRGEGAWLEDDQGRRYLDATASLWYCNVGYGRAELADVAAAQMRELAAYSTFGAYANRPALELAARLAEI